MSQMYDLTGGGDQVTSMEFTCITFATAWSIATTRNEVASLLNPSSK